MRRRSFVKFAAACVVLPALRWVLMSVDDEELNLIAAFEKMWASVKFVPPDNPEGYVIHTWLDLHEKSKRRMGLIVPP